MSYSPMFPSQPHRDGSPLLNMSEPNDSSPSSPPVAPAIPIFDWNEGMINSPDHLMVGTLSGTPLLDLLETGLTEPAGMLTPSYLHRPDDFVIYLGRSRRK